MGDNSCSRGHGFKSRHRILDRHDNFRRQRKIEAKEKEEKIIIEVQVHWSQPLCRPSQHVSSQALEKSFSNVPSTRFTILLRIEVVCVALSMRHLMLHLSQPMDHLSLPVDPYLNRDPQSHLIDRPNLHILPQNHLNALLSIPMGLLPSQPVSTQALEKSFSNVPFTRFTLLLRIEVVCVAAAAAVHERRAGLPLIVVRPPQELVLARALLKRVLEALTGKRSGRRWGHEDAKPDREEPFWRHENVGLLNSSFQNQFYISIYFSRISFIFQLLYQNQFYTSIDFSRISFIFQSTFPYCKVVAAKANV